jgi:superfamily II DNA helicase RecQ
MNKPRPTGALGGKRHSTTPDPAPDTRSVRKVAEHKLGFARLKDEQEEAIRGALAGQDTLCIMPTGSGKSAIYQIAGHLIPRGTVVVSPLIALQKDQVETLAEHDVGNAAAVTRQADDFGSDRNRLAACARGYREASAYA